MISTEFKGKWDLRSCNRGEKGDTFDSYTFFLHNKSFYTLHDFIISVTPARLTWNKLARKDYKTTTFLCVFLNKEINSYNKNIVQLIFQFGSVNSRNLSPLTDQSWLRRLFNEQPQCGGKLAPSLMRSPNLELLNLSILFSLVKLVSRVWASVSVWN